MGKYHKGFKPFISFLSITWTRPTLQHLNKVLLEVLLIESTHLALIIFSLGLRRITAQDYQAPLANIFKREFSQILNWLLKKIKNLSSKHSLCFCFQRKITLKRTNFQILKNSQIFKLRIFSFLLVPNICDIQAFHFFDCLWRLNLKIFKMKKQIWLHVFNDFKSFLANEVELTIEHFDWSKRLFKGSPFVHLKKIKKKKSHSKWIFFFSKKEKKKRLI